MTDARWTDMVGAYVLGALDDAEREAFEARLADDAELRRLVDEARSSTLVLAESLPDLEPPARVKERVLERMRNAQRTSAGDVGPTGEAADGSAAGRGSAGATDTEGPARGRPSAEPDIGPSQGRSSGARPLVPWLLLAASVAGLLWLGNQNRELTGRATTLEEQLASVRASLGEAEVALARFDSMAAALSGPNVQLATLTGDTDPTLRLVWNRDRDLLLVAAQNLPPLPQGRIYQLWGIRGAEAPVGLGTFETDAAGNALVTLASGPTGDFDVSAITEEPAGGSPQPTTTPFLVGAWSTTQ